MATKRKAEAKRWFQQASYDLKAVRWNIQGGFYDTAAEKIFTAIQHYYEAQNEQDILQD